MFRSIFHSRRVNKARKRLISSVSSAAMTIPGISFAGLELRCGNQDNPGLDISDESIREDTPGLHLEVDAENSTTFTEIPIAHSLPSDVSTDSSPTTCPSLKNHHDSNDESTILVELPLPQVIRLLVKIMEPDSVFALDTLLQSTSTSEAEVAISTRIVSDCVFLAHFYYSYYSTRPALFGFTLPRSQPLSIPQGCATIRHYASKRQLPRGGRGNSFRAFPDCDFFQLGFDRVRSKTMKFLNSFDLQRSCDVPLHSPSLFCVDPLFAVCKAWRWPDLRPGEWVRRLPVCRATTRSNESCRLCINPHHWSRVLYPIDPLSSSETTDFDERIAGEPDLLRVGISAIRRRSNTFLLSFSEPATPDKGSQAVELDSPKDFPVTSRLEASQPVPWGPGLSLPNATTSTDHEDNTILMRDRLRNGSETPQIGSSLKNTSSRTAINVLNTSLVTQQSPENSRSTAITELSTGEYGTHGFLTCRPSPNSSTSTSATDDSGPRTRAKKPRPSDSTDSCVENLDYTRSGSERCWAHLSYWEGDRHVAKSWYKLSDRVVYVVYDDDLSRSQFTSRLPDRSGTRRSRGVTCIRLSTLVHRPKTASPMTVSTDSSALPPCVTCNRIALSKSHPDPVSSLGRGERFYRDICYPRFYERSSSWRQCYRLGNQGIVLTLTPQGRVWLANQTVSSESLPIFVSSSCLSSDEKRGGGAPWLVRRVPSGYSIVVFDLILFRNHVAQSSRDTVVHFPNGLGKATLQQLNPPVPVVHISLGKGWGPSYRRPDFTHCPARLELWINVEQLSVVGAVS
ncbi:hypothetical protein CSKR_113987 [Clonorchis sinensis]|uniref:Uncharacterized protein n=2 Tax=Clonorchis sinensis TaxID=79923 RepID=A0A8T1MAF6_CLOSI|nr:hypothetical protein CSKR_113987 [Clonorchis sinensis]GAA36883.2 mothers against decapentaplegic homolog 6 [Clonorchis sinensis]